MLEKIFGKKSTGIIYIICAAFLLLLLAGGILVFVFSYPNAPLAPLIMQTVLTVLALALISAPILIQKRFFLYIPPTVEVSLCIYIFIVFAKTHLKLPQTFSIDLTPAIGGFVIAMTIFTILYSLADYQTDKKQKKLSLKLVTLLTIAASFLILLILAVAFYLISTLLSRENNIHTFLAQAAYYQGGSILFCLTGSFAARSHGDRFRIRSFKNPDSAKQFALQTENKSLYTVVENVSNDTTDYKKALILAKTQFFLARIFYIAIYGAYVVHTCIVFSRLENWGIALIFFLVSSFILTASVYIYEYALFRKNIRNQRLRKLKIAKSIARIYALALILAAMFYSSYSYKPISAALSEGMILFNMCLFFYNMFGKPKHYPSGSSQKNSSPVIEQPPQESDILSASSFNYLTENTVDNKDSSIEKSSSNSDDD